MARRRERLTAAKLLRRALATMNDSGAHWTQNRLRALKSRQVDGAWVKENAYCSIGSIEHELGILEKNFAMKCAGRPMDDYPARGRVAVLALAKAMDPALEQEKGEGDRTFFRRAKGRIVRHNDSWATHWPDIVEAFESAAADLES